MISTSVGSTLCEGSRPPVSLCVQRVTASVFGSIEKASPGTRADVMLSPIVPHGATWIADSGLRVEPQQVIPTHGAQQGLLLAVGAVSASIAFGRLATLAATSPDEGGTTLAPLLDATGLAFHWLRH